MSYNVVHLPRSIATRPEQPRLGLYPQVGHNHHKDMLAVLAEGVCDYLGIIVSASPRSLGSCDTTIQPT